VNINVDANAVIT